MSRENVDPMLEFYDAFNRRDWDAFVALADEEIEVESRLAPLEGAYADRRRAPMVGLLPRRPPGLHRRGENSGKWVT